MNQSDKISEIEFNYGRKIGDIYQETHNKDSDIIVWTDDWIAASNISDKYDGVIEEFDSDTRSLEFDYAFKITIDYDDYYEDRVKRKYAYGGNVPYEDLSKQKPQVVNDSKINETNNIPEIDISLIDETSFNGKNVEIKSSTDANMVFRAIWNMQKIGIQEEMNVLFLNKNNAVIGYYRHSMGGIDGTILDKEMISALAVKCLSKGVIIAHNHPSGNSTPSPQDIDVTKQLDNALKLFNITLLDSLIITKEQYYSLKDEGRFELGGGVDNNIDFLKPMTHDEFVKNAKEQGYKNLDDAVSFSGYRWNGEKFIDKRIKPYTKQPKYAYGGGVGFKKVKNMEEAVVAFLTTSDNFGYSNVSVNNSQGTSFLFQYGTLIAKRTDNEVFISDKKYSNTTSRLQALIKNIAKEKGFSVYETVFYNDGGSVVGLTESQIRDYLNEQKVLEIAYEKYGVLLSTRIQEVKYGITTIHYSIIEKDKNFNVSDAINFITSKIRDKFDWVSVRLDTSYQIIERFRRKGCQLYNIIEPINENNSRFYKEGGNVDKIKIGKYEIDTNTFEVEKNGEVEYKGKSLIQAKNWAKKESEYDTEEVYSEGSLEITRDANGNLHFDFDKGRRTGWAFDTNDVGVAAAIISGSSMKNIDKLRNIEINSNQLRDSDKSEFVYWLSGGNRAWKFGDSDIGYNKSFEETYDELFKDEALKIKKLMQKEKTIGGLLDLFEYYNPNFFLEYAIDNGGYGEYVYDEDYENEKAAEDAIAEEMERYESGEDYAKEYSLNNYSYKSREEILNDLINYFEVENLDYDEDRIKDIIKETFDAVDKKTLSIFDKYKNGGAIEISKSELENIVGRKLNGWNDDSVYYNGKQYKKCYLKPYYKLI